MNHLLFLRSFEVGSSDFVQSSGGVRVPVRTASDPALPFPSL